MFPSVYVCLDKIIEYEDYDNTTDYYRANEYEYEEEDERYGPAERERDVVLNAEVQSELYIMELFREHLLFFYINAYCVYLSPLIRSYQRRDRRESRAFWGRWEKQTHPKNMHNPEPVIHDVGAQNVQTISY